jgi:hypothetical protein
MLASMTCGFYKFFADLGVGWTNIATVLGAVIGVGLSIFAIWFSKKLSDGSAAISEAIRKNTEVTQKQTDAIHRHSKILRIDNLRNLYELSKGQDTHSYWHFRWRFETFDRITVTLLQEISRDERVVLGACELLIQNFSNSAEHIGFENLQPEFYTTRVGSVMPQGGQEFPFAENDLVACFSENLERLIVSKGIDPYTREAKYLLTIGGIGREQSRRGQPTADTATTFPRIKDS